MVKLGDRHAQVAEKKSGEGTSAAPATSRLKEVVDVDSILEPLAPAEKVGKRKENIEIAIEQTRKKIRTISLAKKRKD